MTYTQPPDLVSRAPNTDLRHTYFACIWEIGHRAVKCRSFLASYHDLLVTTTYESLGTSFRKGIRGLVRHPGESRGPEFSWIPASAGMTNHVQLLVPMRNAEAARLDFQAKKPGWISPRLLSIAALLTLLLGLFALDSQAAGPRKEGAATCSRYSIPASVMEKPFFFADELVPIQREDVQSRIAAQINFLLLDARSVLMDWLTERRRYSWIFDEILSKERVPKDFVWFAPVLAGLTKSSGRAAPAGWWALEKPCDSSEGVQMSEDSWHDDRLDLELSTRCFASRLKSIRKDLADEGWLMTAAAYVTSAKTIQDLRSRWETRSYWDLPLPDTAEDLIVRWIALGIISTHKEAFGLKVKNTPPLTFDQITGLSLAKDLSVAEISRMSGVSSREIMEMNPKLKPAAGMFPATEKGKSQTHVIAVPKGKGWIVVNRLKEAGYVSSGAKP